MEYEDFKLVCKTLDPERPLVIITVNPKDQIKTVKEKIEATGAHAPFPASDMRVIWGGKDLLPDQAVEDYGINNSSPMWVVFRLRR